MAVKNFISTIWAARLVDHLDKSLVYGGVVNRDYEGEITGAGAVVKIPYLKDIEVKDYEGTIEESELNGDVHTLNIDQKKYFAFFVDDVDRVQSRPEFVDSAAQRAAYSLADAADQFIASKMAAEAKGAVGSAEAPIVIGSTNKAYDQLIELGTVLSENNVPNAGRFVVVPPWFQGFLLKDEHLVSTGDGTAENARANGYFGKVAGFDIYVSNNVPNESGEKYKIIAGTAAGCTFAQQILNMEAMRSQKAFADVVRGLAVYGAQVVNENALAVLYANKK